MRVRCNGLCNGGTLGSTVKDSGGTQYILSNNHVIGNSNGAQSGDAITQPDCVANSAYTVANFTKFVRLLGSNQTNYVDAAIAKVLPGMVSTNDFILNVGAVSTTLGCSVGLPVEQQGCTTGLRSGQILGCFASVGTSDSCLGTLHYVNQIQVNFTSPVSPGDSGALLVTQPPNPKAVGLHFASVPGTTAGYANWIGNVLQLLGMSGMATPTGASTPQAAQPTPSTELDAEDQLAGQVVNQYAPELMKIPGVWGVEDHLEPDGHIVIRVDVEQVTAEIQSTVPQTLGGFPVEIFVAPMPVQDSAGKHSCTGRAPKKTQPTTASTKSNSGR